MLLLHSTLLPCCLWYISALVGRTSAVEKEPPTRCHAQANGSCKELTAGTSDDAMSLLQSQLRTFTRGTTTGSSTRDMHQDHAYARSETFSDVTDVKFFYEPFIIQRPIFLNQKQEHMWEIGTGKADLDLDKNCSAFAPKDHRRNGHDLVCCDPVAKDGRFSDSLFIRPGMVVPLAENDCSQLSFQVESPGAGPKAASDLLGYDSWSFQHFLDGPSLRIAQNGVYYKNYTATLLASLRSHSSSYANPLVPKMLEKVGLYSLVKPHCESWNDNNPCVQSQSADISLGCSKPPFVPELANKFRSLLGIAEALPVTGSQVVLVLRSRGSQDVNNAGRSFSNDNEVKQAVAKVAEEAGLEFHILDKPINDSVDEVASFFGRTKLLVGAHGGALYNCWFMPPRTGLIEITSDIGEGTSYFHSRAAQFGQVYAPLYQERIGHAKAWSSDIKVRPSDLESIMRKVLKEISESSPTTAQLVRSSS